jgi:hypothetical protein
MPPASQTIEFEGYFAKGFWAFLESSATLPICQAGSSEVFADSSSTGREYINFQQERRKKA